MKVGRVVAVVGGAILALIAFGFVVGGALLAFTYNRYNEDGFLTSPAYELQTTRYALTSDGVEIATQRGDWWPSGLLKIRISAESLNGKPLFIGVGPSDDVDRFLSGVGLDKVVKLGRRTTDISYVSSAGGAPATPPGDQTFWVASTQGTASQPLTWEIERGQWTMVVMNADGSASVQARMDAGVHLPFIVPLSIGLIVGGIFFGICGVVLLVWGAGGMRRASQPTGQPPAPVPPTS